MLKVDEVQKQKIMSILQLCRMYM